MNKEPLQPITESDRQAYERDGVVCLRGMFDQEWIGLLRKAVTEVMANPARYPHKGPSDSDSFVSIIYLWREQGAFRDYILNSPAAEIVGQVLGCDEIRAFQDHLFVKPIGSPHIMPWHHDMTTWAMSGHQVPTLWLALEPVTRENGRLEFVAGYHKKLLEEDVIFRAAYLKGSFGPTAAPVCPNFEEVRGDPDFDYDIVGFDLAPGDLAPRHDQDDAVPQIEEKPIAQPVELKRRG